MRPACFASCSLAALAAIFVLADARDARACGGCFHGQEDVESVVTDHRMVFSVSTQQTVLWDQIRYSGDPKLFAWVLPIKTGARLELSNDAWIAALDAITQPVIRSPQVNCPTAFSGGGGGCGFGAAESDEAFAAAPADAGFHGDDGVTVVSQDVIGPYETVTVRSSMGEALDAWLVANGFLVPDALRPMLSAYANEGFDFLALKLAPGQGVRAMQPVRVVTDGADATLPLRMVAAGIGAKVGITLWVVGEGRYHTQNFPDAMVDFGQLVWEDAQGRSNYAELADAAMAAGDGRGWVTEFAGPVPPPSAQSLGLSLTYEEACNGRPRLPVCVDAGADAAVGGCELPPPPTCDDLEVATAGLHAGSIWITRMRAVLPAAALADADLRLEAEPSQLPVANVHPTTRFADPEFDPCAPPPSSALADAGATNRASPAAAPQTSDGGCACRIGARRIGARRIRFGELLAFGLGAIALTLSIRLRRSRR